jgi:pimeloyl-ACP methyl ester carboxylesterase
MGGPSDRTRLAHRLTAVCTVMVGVLFAAAPRLPAAEPPPLQRWLSPSIPRWPHLWEKGPGRTGPPSGFELHMPTMGGKQFWADELFFHQWHIQRNALSGRCRLLDEHGLRYASGTFQECRAKLEEIRRQRGLPPMHGKAVIVLHGLFRSQSSMNGLCRYLAEQGGYTVFNVAYPSTRRDIAAHARSLALVIKNLEGIEEINFVAHSMGNIVVRRYLGDHTSRRSPSGALPSTVERRPDPRIKRMVMLGPPNHGSEVALTLAENKVFEPITGRSVRQLGLDWATLEDKLATPQFEFGIIAGGRGDDHGFNPLLPGDDDGRRPRFHHLARPAFVHHHGQAGVRVHAAIPPRRPLHLCRQPTAGECGILNSEC